MQAQTSQKPDETFEVEVMREARLEEAFMQMGLGLHRGLSFALAKSDSDLHVMERAIRSGCPPDLMRAIFT